MNKLCLLGLLVGMASQSVMAQSAAATDNTTLQAKNAFIGKLMKQMTLDEKIGQLRLISISGEMPQPQFSRKLLPEESAARSTPLHARKTVRCRKPLLPTAA